MSLFAKDPTAAGLNLPSRVGTGLVLLFSWTHAHLRRGQRCWVGLQEIRAWLLVPSQAWGSCCGRSHWGNQYPGLRSTFLCHSSAAKDRALFPSSPPLLPLRWPQTRPLLAAGSPHSSPGLSHSGGTEHPADQGEKSTPQTLQHVIIVGEKRRDCEAACNAVGSVRVVKPFLEQELCMQDKQPPPAPCRGCRVNS